MAASGSADVPVLERVGTPVTGRLPGPSSALCPPLRFPPAPPPTPARVAYFSGVQPLSGGLKSDLYALCFLFTAPEEGRDPVAGGLGGGSRERRRRREGWPPRGLGSEWMGRGRVAVRARGDVVVRKCDAVPGQ